MASAPWALILGASSGFGEATSLELARSGYSIFGVHMDMRSTLANVERIQDEIKAAGHEAVFFNINAANADKRATVIDAITERLQADGSSIKILLHSLAFGALLPYFGGGPKEVLSKKQIDMTLDVMAHSLVYWTQDIMSRNLMKEGGRIFAMTSSGATRVIKSYGGVSAAKASLESHIRQIAFELAPLGITANAIRAGVTNTPALQRIPGGPELFAKAMEANPSGRATTPEDVAKAIAALADERLHWLTGNVLGVDGGEDLTA